MLCLTSTPVDRIGFPDWVSLFKEVVNNVTTHIVTILFDVPGMGTPMKNHVFQTSNESQVSVLFSGNYSSTYNICQVYNELRRNKLFSSSVGRKFYEWRSNGRRNEQIRTHVSSLPDGARNFSCRNNSSYVCRRYGSHLITS